MAWAEKTPSGKYRGLYRDAAGRRQTVPGGPFTSKAEAKRRAGAAEDEARQQPGRASPRAGRLVWEAWADQWWTTRHVEPGTVLRDVSRRRVHLAPRWDGVRLATISRSDVQGWVDDMAASGMAAATVHASYNLFSGSLRAAALAGKIPASPCVSIQLPRLPLPDDRYLTWPEVEAITHFLSTRDALLVWLLVGTGMRWGEAVGAHTARLDLRAARLDVHEVWDVKAAEMKPYPKGRRKRSVPLPVWLSDKLSTTLAAQRPTPACGGRHRAGSRCRSGLIIPGRDGGPIGYFAWRKRHWLDACARAGVGSVRIHDLRHTYASWILQDGVSLEALSELLGHASLTTTQRYAHLADTQWEKVRAALERRPATDLPHDGSWGIDARSIRPVS